MNTTNSKERMPSVLRGKFSRYTEQVLEKAFIVVMKAKGLTAAQAVSSKIKASDLLIHRQNGCL